jgi:hypothetical protein
MGIKANLLIGSGRFKWDDPDIDRYNKLRESCQNFRNDDFLVAVDSKSISVSINNLSVEVRELLDRDIESKFSRGKAMLINGYIIPIDKADANKYLKDYYRIIDISFSVDIYCNKDIVGGGLLFEKTEHL